MLLRYPKLKPRFLKTISCRNLGSWRLNWWFSGTTRGWCYRVRRGAAAQGYVALHVAMLLLYSVACAGITMYVDTSYWMHLIVGARGLHELGDKGTPQGPREHHRGGYITLIGNPWMCISDSVFIHVCPSPLPTIIADCTPYTVGSVGRLYCPVMTAFAAVVK